MDKVTIDRELLERELLSVLDFSESNLRRVVDHLIDAGYTRAAPRQPEGEGMEVVAWQDAENPLYTTAERRVLHDWVNNGYPIVELCRLSDHQRAIAELREECSFLKECQENYMLHMTGLVAERDTLRQQLAERDAEIERLRVKLMTIASAEPGRHNIEWAKAMAATGNNEAYAKWREAFDQCGRLAELLRQARLKMGYMLNYGEWHSPEELIERIYAELSEVK